MGSEFDKEKREFEKWWNRAYGQQQFEEKLDQSHKLVAEFAWRAAKDRAEKAKEE